MLPRIQPTKRIPLDIMPPIATGTAVPYFQGRYVLTFEESETALGFANKLDVFIFHVGDKESGMTFHDYRKNTVEYVKDVFAEKVEYDASEMLRLLSLPTVWSLYSEGEDAMNTTVASGDVLINLDDTDASEDETETLLLGMVIRDESLPVYMPEWEILRAHENTEHISYVCLMEK